MNLTNASEQSKKICIHNKYVPHFAVAKMDIRAKIVTSASKVLLVVRILFPVIITVSVYMPIFNFS